MQDGARISIDLTHEQQGHIKTASGHEIDVVELEFKADELEQRAVPSFFHNCCSGTHYATVIIE